MAESGYCARLESVCPQGLLGSNPSLGVWWIMKFSKKELKIFLSVIGVLFFLIGCSKNMNQKSVDGNEITATVIEDSKENCRLSNESDCRPIEIRRGEPEKKETINALENANAANITNKTINIEQENISLSDCYDGWKCVEANYMAYQFSNCSWVSIEYCVYGCKNNTCSPAPICKPNSLKCDNDNLKICNDDGSEWKLNESCDYKCENSVCIGKNLTINSTANLTNTTNSNNTTNSTNTTQFHDFMSDNCMSLLRYNLTGNTSTDEYITLKNSCTYTMDITNWTANDEGINYIYKFPSFNLASNADIKLITGKGTNNATTLYWGRGSAVWNNGGDTLYLNASNGTSVLIKSLTP